MCFSTRIINHYQFKGYVFYARTLKLYGPNFLYNGILFIY